MYYPTGMGALGCCGAPMSMAGLGAEEGSTQGAMGSGTTWVAGGLLVGLAVLMFAIETKDPLGLKKAS